MAPSGRGKIFNVKLPERPARRFSNVTHGVHNSQPNHPQTFDLTKEGFEVRDAMLNDYGQNT